MNTKLLLSCGLFFLLSCGPKKAELSGEQPLTAEEVMEAYPELNLPVTIADTNILKKTDTTRFSKAALSTVLPDTILTTYVSDKTTIRPLGKIVKDEETYLLTTFIKNKQPVLTTFVFDKKKKFLAHLLLLNTAKKDGYIRSVSINREPTFSVNREKQVRDADALYTRNAFAFNKDAKGFINVLSDSNEGNSSVNDVTNPIDTMPRSNKFSGDYIKDKKNYMSLRDGRNGSTYLFFIYFSKNNGDCVGELKGELTITSNNKAIYSANGDPCVIDFTFKGNSIAVKEQGSCGNHRGIKCYFDDTYTKKKEPKKKKK